MSIDELFELWKKDSEIDRSELGEASAVIPQLHYKYYKIFAQERLKLRKLEAEYKVLYKDIWEYFQGNMSEEDLKGRGWEPNPLRILKSDLGVYIDSDKDIITHNMKIAYQKEKIDFLESVIKTINIRGFHIKNAIDWEKFKVGI
jgi:hypothetical protein